MALKKRNLKSIIRVHIKKWENIQVCQSYHQDSEAINSKISQSSAPLPCPYLLIGPWLPRIFSSTLMRRRDTPRNWWSREANQLFLQDIKRPDCGNWESELHAMECAWHLENLSPPQLHNWLLIKMTPICVTPLRFTTWMSRPNPSKYGQPCSHPEQYEAPEPGRAEDLVNEHTLGHWDRKGWASGCLPVATGWLSGPGDRKYRFISLNEDTVG